jgi:indole-3-acetate monooxygenase
VRGFLPRIDAGRAEAERARRMPHELIRDMAGAGVFRLKAPARYGGAELDHLTYHRILEEVARTDASAAWLIAIANEGAAGIGYLSETAAEEIFGPDPDIIIASGLKARQVEVQPADGGFHVRGRWALASGCPEAAWFAAAVTLASTGRPDLRVLMIPREQCTIVETWDALGLRATSSHDFAVDGAFVPERRQIVFPGRSALPGPAWRGDMRSHLGGLGSVALGVARAARDEFVALAAHKVPLFSQTPLRERATAQTALAHAEVLVRSARAFLHEVLAAMWETECRGAPPTEEQLVLRELAVVHAIQAGATSINLLYQAAGSDAVYTGTVLERCFRDAHVMTQHFAGSTSRYEQLGRFLMTDARSP